jgi:hypothetical protein
MFVVILRKEYLSFSESAMNNRKDPPSLDVVLLRHIRKMFKCAAIKWTGRIHKNVHMHNKIWLQHINMIDEECTKVRRRIGCFPMAVVMEIVGDPVFKGVTNIISSYDRTAGSRTFTTPTERHIYENTCQNMLKTVLFPCRTR